MKQSGRALVFCMMLLPIIACNDFPDQDQFQSLTEISQGETFYNDAFARAYRSPLSPPLDFFTHPWIVVKPAFSAQMLTFEVTEVNDDTDSDCEPFFPYSLSIGEEHCGHITVTAAEPSRLEYSYYGVEGTIMGEIIGAEATPIISFIMDQSRHYSCRYQYNPLNINSNTYVQWLLENTDWDIKLGAGAHGQTFTDQCFLEEPMT